MKYTIILFLNLIFFLSVNAQNTFWHKSHPSKIEVKGERQINAEKFTVFELDVELLKSQLKDAPLEFTDEATINPVIIKLPMPEGGFENFAVVESPVMSKVLSAKFPDIRTYAASGVEDKSAILRFDITAKGFHAMIMRSEGTVFIDPYSSLDTENYMVYNKRDFIPSADKKFECFADDHIDYTEEELENAGKGAIGEELRVYRLAVATTVEYSNYHGGTVESVLSAITTTVNRVVGVYRRDLSITMELIDESEDIINIDSDSFSNNDASALLSQNAQFLNNTIGIAAYDIGHVLSTASGGIASLGCVCNATYKAYGTTGVNSPIGDPFDIDYVAHEIGHQFGANHSFNGNVGACNGNRVSQSAYEPGSGSTIMAYAGICGSHNIQNRSDDYFHLHSIREIDVYVLFQTGGNCPDVIETGNTPPVVEILVSNLDTIPNSTPFELIGSATDIDGDSLTYCWEQKDLGFAGNPNSPQGNAPLFRSFLPTPDSVRIFPKLADILSQTQVRGEILPSYARDMEFTLAVRDNNVIAGGLSSNFIQLGVTDEAGPFIVTGPSTTGTTWFGGEPALIEWDVANTDQAPVNCALVDIYFSTNGGESFDYLLSEGTANDGTANITIPENLELETTEGRVKVKCSDNVFFNINKVDIEVILPKVEVLTDANEEIETCKGDYAIVPIYVDITDGYESNVTLSTTNLPTGWTASFSENPVAAPDTVEMLITTTSNANGVFNVNVNAFSNSLTTVSLALDIVVLKEEVLSVAPALQAPINGENLVTGNDIIFSWENLEVATGYAVEIATSPLFTPESIVGNFDGLTENAYTLPDDTLAEDQLYHWRVYSSNECLTGINS